MALTTSSAPPAFSRQWADIVFALLLMAVAVGLYLEAGNYSATGAAFPRVLTVLLALCALAVIVRVLKHPDARHVPLLTHPARVILGGMLVFAFIVAMDLVGYIAASILFGIGIPLLYGFRQWRLLLPVVLGTLGFIIVVFRLLLERPLPQGILESLLERVL